MVKVVKGLPAGWGACSQTTLLDSTIYSMSHHNNSIAVGSYRDITILDVITGSHSGILSGHTDVVCCLFIRWNFNYIWEWR